MMIDYSNNDDDDDDNNNNVYIIIQPESRQCRGGAF